jgi:glutamate/tyrosine decarboxylase-like PLP-dependent enzyme
MNYDSFPEIGMSRSELDALLDSLKPADEDARASFGDRWLNDRGLLLDDGALEVAKAAHLAYFTKNNSNSTIMELERELVAWTLNLFHAREGAAGTLTSGGSESLFLATAAALAKFQHRSGDNRPSEVVIPETGYPTFEKYSRYLGYDVRRVPVDEKFRADPEAMESAITERTFMILGSFSSWAHGACDPIPALSDLAMSRQVWLHVDACVGGMLAPFARELGRKLPDFDFSLPGVNSISVDFHKYGYSSKGVSGIFFRNYDLATEQTFAFDNWSAGLYRSPVFTGTRSGGAIASAWAVAKYLGLAGYRRRTAQVLKARDAIVNEVESNQEVHLLGGADLGTVAIGSDSVSISALSERLREKGWGVNRLKDPDGIQLVLGPMKDSYIEAFVGDFSRAVDLARRENAPRDRGDVVYSDEVVRGPGAITGER